MPRKSKTATSTPRLSEYARAFIYPDTIKRTVWPRVEARGRELGLGFDWWQRQLGTVVLGYDEHGKYAATVGGIGMSIPRQVGKTYFVLAMLTVLCDLYPGLQVIWTAHHLQTTSKTFASLRGMCQRKGVAAIVDTDNIRVANGEWRVPFRNGSLIRFGSRKFGFGRGFDEIDIEVFDEAQILDLKSLEDMIAATNQARHEHGALLFYMGTPPRPLDPSEAFSQRRAEALAGESEDAVWLEIGADPKSAPDDRSQWPRMNPSYPKRTPLESMLRLKKNLADDDSWNREGRGVWDDLRGAAIFGEGRWEARLAPPASLGDERWVRHSLALSTSFGLTHSAIVAAAVDADDVVHVKPIQHGPGIDWAVARAKELQDAHGVDVVVDGKSPSAVLVPHLERAGVRLRVLKTENVLDACADFYNRVREGRAEHGGYRELDAAARVARSRAVGDRWALDRKKSEVSALDAAILAAYPIAGASKDKPEPRIRVIEG